MELQDHGKFHLLDYVFFVIVIILSAGIGLYYAIKSRKTVTTVEDYLLGGRTMGLFPVSCSLAATSITAMTSVGLAAEAYTYGTYIWIYAYDTILTGIFVSWIFLPLFSELQLTSVFKYFELRFSQRVRLLASGLYLFSGTIYLSYIVYAPALTFQRVSGVNTYVTIVVLSAITAIYTAIGGFKAVIWTDAVQLVFIFSSVIVVMAVGIYSVNGIENVLDAAGRGGRIMIANPVLNSRTSIWGHTFSTVFLALYNHGLNQTNMQRYLSFTDLRKMRISLWVLVIMYSIFVCLSSVLGAIMYANYETCDPFIAGIIPKIDQIVPHFIQDKAYLFSGFNGIFIAGIFSASLSTASSYLNAMSGLIYEDFIRHKYPRIKGNTVGRIMKTTVFILAGLQIGLVSFIEQMGTMAQIGIQVLSLNACGLLTLFFLGIFVPKTNSKGAQAGAVAAIACILTLIIGSLDVKPEATLPFRTDGCMNNVSLAEMIINSNVTSVVDGDEDVFWLFKINYNYYCLIGLIVGLGIGYAVSVLTGGNAVEDQKLIAKFLRRKDLQMEDMQLRENILEF